MAFLARSANCRTFDSCTQPTYVKKKALFKKFNCAEIAPPYLAELYVILTDIAGYHLSRGPALAEMSSMVLEM